MVHTEKELSGYLEAFERVSRDEPNWLAERRRLAIERFSLLGFPSARDEEYKYTPLTVIAKAGFLPAAEDESIGREDLAPAEYEGLDGVRLVFLDGRYRQELSDLSAAPEGVEIASIAAILRQDPARLEGHLTRYADFEDQATTALNTALFEDGAFVRVPDGVRVEQPIHIVFASSASRPDRVSHPRTLIVVGRSAEVSIVETFFGIGGERYWTNQTTEIVAEANARVRHYKAQQEKRNAFHTGRIEILQERAANVVNFSLSFGAALARHDIRATLDDEGGECALDGLYVVSGEQHVDHHTVLDHAKPHCNSHQLYKGVLDGRSRAVFNGKILVRQGAEKTDAIQHNKNLLLSDDAVVDTKPQLEIFNNDVRCTHGATVGQLDSEALFYLRSRGIGREQARSLLTYAFAADALARVELEPLRKHFGRELRTLLSPEGGESVR